MNGDVLTVSVVTMNAAWEEKRQNTELAQTLPFCK